MKRIGTVTRWLPIVLALAVASPLPAQERDASVLAAAVGRVADMVRREPGAPPGPVRFDSRILIPRQVQTVGAIATVFEPGEVLHPDADSVRSLLGAESGTITSARRCPTSSLRSCFIPGAGANFAATRPEMRGDTMRVVVHAVWQGGLAKQPVQEGTFAVSLVRAQDEWCVREVRTIRIT